MNLQIKSLIVQECGPLRDKAVAESNHSAKVFLQTTVGCSSNKQPKG